MWHSDYEHSSEEKEVLRELEYDLFMANIGFRNMWDNNFEEYFEALFDKQKWMNHHENRYGNLEQDESRKMMEDREYGEFMRHEALIDSVLFGDLPYDNAPFEIQREIDEIRRESKKAADNMEFQERLGIAPDYLDPWQKDPLFNQAYEWGHSLGNEGTTLYEKIKNKELFRVITNCGEVGSHMIEAMDEGLSLSPAESRERKRTSYNLSLKSLRRCLESLEKLLDNQTISSKLAITIFIKTGKDLQQQIIDKLDALEQERYKV